MWSLVSGLVELGGATSYWSAWTALPPWVPQPGSGAGAVNRQHGWNQRGDDSAKPLRQHPHGPIILSFGSSRLKEGGRVIVGIKEQKSYNMSLMKTGYGV